MGNGESSLEPELKTLLPDTTHRFIGLENDGNTCFANAVLQLLFAVPAMRERAIQYYLLVQQGLVVRDPNTVLDALGELFHRMASHDTRTGTLSASLLMRRMRTVDGLRDMSAYGEQHDVHELFCNIVNNCEETVQRARNSASAMRDPLMRDVVCAAFAHTVGGTFVNDAFEGLLRNETRCGACDTVTSRDEPFLALSLDIVQDGCSVLACLKGLCEVEVLSETFVCDSSVCGGKQQPSAQKRVRLARSPNVLVLHLKRFRFVPARQGFVKLHQRVLFGSEIKLWIAEDDPDALYTLMGLVVHAGATAGSGHYVYVSYVEGHWFLFNDDFVRPVTLGQLSSFYGGGQAATYMLVYRRQQA